MNPNSHPFAQQAAGNRTSLAVLDEMKRKRVHMRDKGSPLRQEIKQLLTSLQFYSKPDGFAGIHLCEVLQVPNLLDVIVKEVECKKHFLRRDQKPKLKLLALRYGVTEKAIRSYNGLEDASTPLGNHISFLYIPPSDYTVGSSRGLEDALLPSRISRSELTEKLRQRSRSADFSQFPSPPET